MRSPFLFGVIVPGDSARSKLYLRISNPSEALRMPPPSSGRKVTPEQTADDFSYNAISDPSPIHDVQATVLHCLGIDHTRLTYKFQGRHFRLTDVAGIVNRKVLA